MVSALLVLGGMASAGIPGLVGFVTEFLVFQGSYAVYPVQTLLGVIGTGLTAVYFVILLNRTCFGKLDNAIAYFPKVTFSEKLPAYVLAGLILFLGIQPNWLVKWGEPTATAMIANLPMVLTEVIADEVIEQLPTDLTPAEIPPAEAIPFPVATLPTLP
jgi:NAD(P)H-quinone oxidoreductase subunit 4